LRWAVARWVIQGRPSTTYEERALYVLLLLRSYFFFIFLWCRISGTTEPIQTIFGLILVVGPGLLRRANFRDSRPRGHTTPKKCRFSAKKCYVMADRVPTRQNHKIFSKSKTNLLRRGIFGFEKSKLHQFWLSNSREKHWHSGHPIAYCA
jgi:hypothetical protein